MERCGENMCMVRSFSTCTRGAKGRVITDPATPLHTMPHSLAAHPTPATTPGLAGASHTALPHTPPAHLRDVEVLHEGVVLRGAVAGLAVHALVHGQAEDGVDGAPRRRAHHVHGPLVQREQHLAAVAHLACAHAQGPRCKCQGWLMAAGTDGAKCAECDKRAPVAALLLPRANSTGSLAHLRRAAAGRAPPPARLAALRGRPRCAGRRHRGAAGRRASVAPRRQGRRTAPAAPTRRGRRAPARGPTPRPVRGIDEGESSRHLWRQAAQQTGSVHAWQTLPHALRDAPKAQPARLTPAHLLPELAAVPQAPGESAEEGVGLTCVERGPAR